MNKQLNVFYLIFAAALVIFLFWMHSETQKSCEALNSIPTDKMDSSQFEMYMTNCA